MNTPAIAAQQLVALLVLINVGILILLLRYSHGKIVVAMTGLFVAQSCAIMAAISLYAKLLHQ